MGIDITGNNRIKTQEVRDNLKEFGVYPGAKIKNIDRQLVKNKMMTRIDDLSWIGINIRGSRVYVEVKERLDTPLGIDNTAFCDLVAITDGIIDELDVREGQSVVKVKEFVEKGDLLVSGAVDSVTQGIRYVHSFGEVYALTEYEEKEEFSLTETERIYTGKEKKKRSILLFGKKINFYLKDKTDFKNYEKTTVKKESIIPGLYTESIVYKEQEIKKTQRSEKEVFEKAKKELSEKIKKSLQKNCTVKDISAKYEKKDKNTLIVYVKFMCRENIAEQRLIDKIENLNYDIEDQ